MQDRITNILKRSEIPYKQVLVLGAFIHISFHSKKQCERAARLFPGSHYHVRMFDRPVETPHGKRKYGKEWKTVVQVKPLPTK